MRAASKNLSGPMLTGSPRLGLVTISPRSTRAPSSNGKKPNRAVHAVAAQMMTGTMDRTVQTFQGRLNAGTHRVVLNVRRGDINID